MQLKLEVADIRKIKQTTDGMGYVAVLAVRGPRGARYRPVRSKVFVTLGAAEKALADLERRFVHGKQLPSRREVVAVEAKLTQDV